MDYLVEVETDVVAFLYREDNLQDLSILDELEHIDDDLDEKGIQFCKCSDRGVERRHGLGAVPAVVHFHHGVPLSFDGGDVDDADAVLAWVTANLEGDDGASREVSASVLDVLVEKHGSLAALFHTNGASDLPEDMGTLEDACDEDAVTLVTLRDEGKTMQLGLGESRALVYFEDRLPSLYSGSLANATAMAKWILKQKKTDALPMMTDGILENVVHDFEYVAAFFPSTCKGSDARCKETAAAAEGNLDEVADSIRELGVAFVACREKVLAVRYLICTYDST